MGDSPRFSWAGSGMCLNIAGSQRVKSLVRTKDMMMDLFECSQNLSPAFHGVIHVLMR